MTSLISLRDHRQTTSEAPDPTCAHSWEGLRTGQTHWDKNWVTTAVGWGSGWYSLQAQCDVAGSTPLTLVAKLGVAVGS